MEEVKKIARTTARLVDGAPHQVLLVIDATTGQNALAQARVFHEALGVTAVVLTKLDGTAKGGVALAIRSELGLPIRYVGLGEKAGGSGAVRRRRLHRGAVRRERDHRCRLKTRTGAAYTLKRFLKKAFV